MTTTSEAFDEAKAGEFAGAFMNAINGASMIALASVGSHAGLFDAMAGMPPSTSQAIAGTAGLHERYVREWLGGMVVAKVIDYEPVNQTYHLPAEHAAFLTTSAGPNNLTTIAQVFPYLGLVQDKLVESFRQGGGVPYASYPHFQEVQMGMTGPFFEATLVETVLPMAPGLREKLSAGADALDIGTGAGHAVNLMATAFPNSRFTGYDFEDDGIRLAREEARRMGLANARFEVKDVAASVEPGKYDLITAFEVVHDLAHPQEVLKAVYDSLKLDGTFLIIDIAASSKLEENIDHPLGPTLYTFSVFHCMTVSLAQGGAGLGTVVGEQRTTDLLREAGFKNIDVRHVEGDVFYAYYVVHK